MAKLYTCGINDLKTYANIKHRFFIAQYIKDKEGISKYGFAQMPNLAPEKALVNEYIRLKNAKLWSERMFEEWYTPLFLKQMYTRNETRGALNYIYKLITNGDDVVIACYCHNKDMCHRTLIAQEMAKHGICVVNE